MKHLKKENHMNGNEAQIAEYKKTIDNILESTMHDKLDERVRNRIATSMSRAINMSKMTGDGSVRQPRQTVLYRFATILKDCNTFEQLDKRCREAFQNRYDCRAWKLLEKFDIDWDIKFDIPETRKEKKAREERERLALIEEETIRQQGEPEKELAVVAQNSVDNALTKKEAEAEDILDVAKVAPIAITAVEASIHKLEQRLEKKIEELREIIRHHQHLEGNKVVVITEV